MSLLSLNQFSNWMRKHDYYHYLAASARSLKVNSKLSILFLLTENALVNSIFSLKL